MKNDIIDTSYLALELTKIYFNNIQDTHISPSDIATTYKGILADLTGVKELPSILTLEEENERITALYKALKQDIDNNVHNKIDSTIKAIKKALDNNKGNMEPYVYSNIMDIIDLNV